MQDFTPSSAAQPREAAIAHDRIIQDIYRIALPILRRRLRYEDAEDAAQDFALWAIQTGYASRPEVANEGFVAWKVAKMAQDWLRRRSQAEAKIVRSLDAPREGESLEPASPEPHPEKQAIAAEVAGLAVPAILSGIFNGSRPRKGAKLIGDLWTIYGERQPLSLCERWMLVEAFILEKDRHDWAILRLGRMGWTPDRIDRQAFSARATIREMHEKLRAWLEEIPRPDRNNARTPAID